MSNFSYDDFAVLVRKFNPEMLSPESLKSLRIVPLSTAPSMADAIKGTNLTGIENELNLPREKNGTVVLSNVEVQHNSDGYCRLVGHVVKAEGDQPLTIAKAFALYHTVNVQGESGVTSKKEVIAVASLKEGFEIGDVCYPSFTITTVNNYQSVAFNPNAFATVEDLKNINGLEGLHIAFDTDSGDLKLLDKDGNVLDQANLPIKADVIIADGEEGYKYVKTDVKQDIHAAKAWMPEGFTAWEAVPPVDYIMQHAALVVDKGSTSASKVFVEAKIEKRHPISTESVQFDHVVIDGSTYMVADKNETETQCSLLKVKGNDEAPSVISAGISGGQVTYGDPLQSYDITNGAVEADVIKGEDGVTTYVLAGTYTPDMFKPRFLDGRDTTNIFYEGRIETSGGSSTGGVVGITLGEQSMYTFEEGATTTSEFKDISGGTVTWFGTKTIPEGYTLKYGLEAFVWTVRGAEDTISDPFFQQLNNSLLALGFHEGDDIALGTNLAKLSTDLNGVDADEYMHGETKNESGKTNKELREQEVNAQRANAKEELVAWNAQHPALKHDGSSGTRISSGGVDIRNGKILIGDGNSLGNDAVKHYELSTNFSSNSAYQQDQGLAFSAVTDASSGNLVNSNVLTISRYGYISGAPICMAMAEITESEGAIGFALIRRTSCFGCDITEAEGNVTITIKDNRLNSAGFSGECIVEISPVYISAPAETSETSAHETLPALNMVNTVAESVQGNPTQLTCTCPQIIDWANSVNISSASGARMFVIVKVY